jgi:hypothetical protein
MTHAPTSLASRKTFRALMGRGCPNRLSEKLAAKFTVAQLKSKSDKELAKLGLTADVIDALRKTARRPIPLKTVIRLLIEAHSTCCRCRDSSRPVIIHHMQPWHESKDHDESNLIILCLSCHSEAHSRYDLSQNLTADVLKGMKENWLKKVAASEADTLIGASQVPFAFWDYINHARLFQLVDQLGIEVKSIQTYPYLRSDGLITPNGELQSPERWKIPERPRRYLYDFGQPGANWLHHYMVKVLERVLAQLPLIDITDRWNRSEINAAVKTGAVIAFQGGFRFKATKGAPSDRELRTGYHQARGIRLQFAADLWECASSSSYSNHLRGNHYATAVCIVRGTHTVNGTLTIETTCLGIGTGFTTLSKQPGRGPMLDSLREMTWEEPDEEGDEEYAQ